MENKDIDLTVSGGDALPSFDTGQTTASSGDVMPQQEIQSVAPVENQGQENMYVTADEIREAVYQSLEDYFSAETVMVSIEKDMGLSATIDDLGLTDILLLAIFLIMVGRGICDVIGGKGWRK